MFFTNLTEVGTLTALSNWLFYCSVLGKEVLPFVVLHLHDLKEALAEIESSIFCVE